MMKKKVLIVASIPFGPVERGNQKLISDNIILFQKLGCEVDYLYTGNLNGIEQEYMRGIIGIEHLFWVDKRNLKKKNTVREGVRSFISNSFLKNKIAIPYMIDELCPDEMVKEVQSLHLKRKYDIIWVEYVFLSGVLVGLDNKVYKIIETHDKSTGRSKEFLREKLEPTGFYTTYYSEKKGLKRANCIVSIQKEEEAFFKKMLGKKSDVWVKTYSGLLSAKSFPLQKEKKVCFIGTKYSLNQYALEWFLKSVWPIIKKKIPQAEFYIVGRVCEMIPDSVQYLKKGFVEDLDALYASVRVIVNPVQSGNGMNIKMIEAIAHCKPIVSTTSGSRGINCDKELYKCADDAEGFAEEVIRLLNDDTECEKLSQNCLEYISDYNMRNEKVLREVLQIG